MQACPELWGLNLTDNNDNDVLLQEACFSNQHVRILRVTKGPKMNSKKYWMLWTGFLKVAPEFAC
jgi:hypothetical protein